LHTPVLLLIFNRLSTTQHVFYEIKKAKPKKFYIACDGPKSESNVEINKVKAVRDFVYENIDWECKVETYFRDTNSGCKYGVSGGIDWFFNNEEMGIVLEDDTVPCQSFFWFCQELLERYKDDYRVMQINGTNFFWNQIQNHHASYFFSKYGNIWGWASWRRAWKLYDVNINNWKKLKKHFLGKLFENKKERIVREQQIEKILNGQIDTWDFQWILYKHLNAGLNIIPNNNMVKNIGFIEDSTHTKSNKKDIRSNLPIKEMQFPLLHTNYIFSNIEYDALMRKRILSKYYYKKIKNIFRPLK
jgi:hypothetical protein